MKFFDRLFYHYVLRGKWDKRHSDERTSDRACRFFGFIAGVNTAGALCIAAAIRGFTDIPGWLFRTAETGGLGAVMYVCSIRKRYVPVSRRSDKRSVGQSGLEMTGRFLQTIFRSCRGAVAGIPLHEREAAPRLAVLTTF